MTNGGAEPGIPGGPDVLVVGYASIDRVWRAASRPGPGRTAILEGPVDPAPAFGGCGPNVAIELARLGLRTALVTWLGDDSEGRAYLAYLASAGVDLTAVEVASKRASPRTILVYDPDGGATCLYHPSGSRGQRLSDSGRRAAGSARLLAVTVCPAQLTVELLDARRADALVAWNVKADDDAYPPALRQRLLREARLVCLNRDELAFISSSELLTEPRAAVQALETLRVAPDAIVALTIGPGGSLVRAAGVTTHVPAEVVEVSDPTGAGDAYFAGFVAALVAGRSAIEAAQAATRHAAAYLRRKASGAARFAWSFGR
jgi:sugar/nucleoside kinase (ribokinase family)